MSQSSPKDSLKARAQASLDANPSLSAEHKRHYAEQLGRVLDVMPEAAVAKMDANVKEFKFYGDVDAVTAEAKARSKSARRLKEVFGFFTITEGMLHLDGNRGQTSAETGDWYAHELSHALDKSEQKYKDGSPRGQYSGQASWQEAWEHEMRQGQPSGYSRNHPREGFAEFARLVYGRRSSADALREKFPKATAFFEAQGLFPAGNTGKDVTLEEAFKEPLVTPNVVGDSLAKLREKVEAQQRKLDAGEELTDEDRIDWQQFYGVLGTEFGLSARQQSVLNGLLRGLTFEQISQTPEFQKADASSPTKQAAHDVAKTLKKKLAAVGPLAEMVQTLLNEQKAGGTKQKAAETTQAELQNTAETAAARREAKQPDYAKIDPNDAAGKWLKEQEQLEKEKKRAKQLGAGAGAVAASEGAGRKDGRSRRRDAGAKAGGQTPAAAPQAGGTGDRQGEQSRKVEPAGETVGQGAGTAQQTGRADAQRPAPLTPTERQREKELREQGLPFKEIRTIAKRLLAEDQALAAEPAELREDILQRLSGRGVSAKQAEAALRSTKRTIEELGDVAAEINELRGTNYDEADLMEILKRKPPAPLTEKEAYRQAVEEYQQSLKEREEGRADQPPGAVYEPPSKEDDFHLFAAEARLREYGLANERMDLERVARKLPKVIETAKRADPVMWDKAMREMARNPSAATDILTELRESPRPLVGVENFILLRHWVDLSNQHYAAMDALAAARSSKDPVAIAVAEQNEDALNAQSTMVRDLSKKAFSEAGYTLRTARLLANEDFSLLKMLARKAVAKGELSTEDKLEVKKLHDEMQALRDRMAKMEADAQQASKPKKIKNASFENAVARFMDVAADLFASPTNDLYAMESDPRMERAVEMARAFKKTGAASVEKFIEQVELHVGKPMTFDAEQMLRNAWDIAGQKKPLTDEQRLNNAMKAVDRAISEVEQRLEENDLAPKAKTPGPSSEELEAKRAKLAELREQLQNRRKGPPKTPEQKAVEGKEKTAAKVQERIDKKDYAPKEKKAEPDTPEYKEAKRALEKKQLEFERGLIQHRRDQRTKGKMAWDAVVETAAVARAVMTSIDASAVGRQGGILAMGHPQEAAQAFAAMSFAAFSQKNADAQMEAILNRPLAELGKKAGLAITDNLNTVEENYASEFVRRPEILVGKDFAQSKTGKTLLFPLAGVRASERAYVAFLNAQRAARFDAMVTALGGAEGVTDAEAKAIANFVNVFTGRGNLGMAENAATHLAMLFFSPRFVASRFQLLLGQPLWQGSARTRMMILREYGRSLTGLTLVYSSLTAAAFAWAALGGDDDDKPTISFDPDTPDFGKFKIGKTRIDPMAGLAQATRFGFAAGKGALHSTLPESWYKKLQPLIGKPANDGFVQRFLRTKLAPIPGAIWSTAEGKNAIGKKTTAFEQGRQLVTPMALRDVWEAYQQHKPPMATFIAVAALLGWSSQTYEKR